MLSIAPYIRIPERCLAPSQFLIRNWSGGANSLFCKATRRRRSILRPVAAFIRAVRSPLRSANSKFRNWPRKRYDDSPPAFGLGRFNREWTRSDANKEEPNTNRRFTQID